MASKKRTFKSDMVRSQGLDYCMEYDKTERMYNLIAELAGYGLLDSELAKLFSIDYRRFAEMKAGDPELMKALEIGKARAIANVSKALYNKAIGYTVDEITDTIATDESDGSVKHTVSTKTKHVPPSDNAIIFWLSNKASDSWKQSSKISIGRGSDDVDLSSMDEQALKAYIESMKKKLEPKKDVEQLETENE